MKKTAHAIHKQHFILSVRDAVENLSAISQMDVDSPIPIGIISKNHFVIQNEEVIYPEVLWLAPETAQEILPKLEDTYLSILAYLEELYEEDETDWESPKVQKGISAIMLLLGEAVEKLDEFASFWKKEKEFKHLIHSTEYLKLQNYYLKTFSKKFPHPLEGKEAWNESWRQSEHAFELDLSKSAINNFEAVKEDEDYELFLLYDDSHHRFITPELIKNIELVCDFDELVSTSSPEKMDKLQIREIQMRARQIYRNVSPFIAAFYKRKFPIEKNNLPYHLHKIIVALLMTANPATVHSAKKNSFDYFVDFQHFIREAFHLPDVIRMVNMTGDLSTEDKETLLSLYFGLSHSFFTVPGGIRGEMLGLIHKFINQGMESLIKKGKDGRASLSFCDQLSLDEERIREGLINYPNSPLLFHLQASKEHVLPGFDPLLQKNTPAKCLEIHTTFGKIDLLRIPSPTRQEIVSTAMIDEEFLGFLEALKRNNQKHLLLNLQDLSSWQEAARSSALEKTYQDYPSLEMISLDAHSDFYHQSGSFAKIEDASVFKETFLEHISNKEKWGFSFPIAHISMHDLCQFTKDLLDKIHTNLFENSPKLTQKNRKDFILITYQFLLWKILSLFHPQSISFTCKDSLDIGSTFQTAFVGFSRLIEKGHFVLEDRNLFLWLIHSQALLIRHRPANIERVERMLSSLDFLEQSAKKNPKKFRELFSSLLPGKKWDISVHPLE